MGLETCNVKNFFFGLWNKILIYNTNYIYFITYKALKHKTVVIYKLFKHK